MDSARKRPGSITFLLMGLVLLVVAGTVALAPVITCPEYCLDGDISCPGSSQRCPRCKGSGRITLWENVRYKSENRELEPLMTDDGKDISDVVFIGFRSEQMIEARKLFGLKKNDQFNRRRALNARDRLSRVDSFRDLEFEVRPDQLDSRNRVIITITLIQKNHRGHDKIPDEKFKLQEEKK